MIKLPQSRRGKVIAVAVLAVCAMALFKPFAWLNYLTIETPVYIPLLFLRCVLPSLAAFIAGPLGAITVSACAVCPRILLYHFDYPLYMVVYNILLAVNEFAQISIFSCEFYSMGRKGGRKNILLGLICGGRTLSL